MAKHSAPAAAQVQMERPSRLPTEAEKAIAPAEEIFAACYASMEDLRDKFHVLADQLAPEPAIEIHEEDSAVHHIEEIRVKLSSTVK